MNYLNGVLLVFGSLMIGGCTNSSRTCESRSEDTAWQKLGERNIQMDIERFSTTARDYDSAVDVFGAPDRSRVVDGKVLLTWSSGSRRTGRTFSCGRLVEETHQVTYAMLDILFSEKRSVSCHVRFLEYIGDMKNPNPFVDVPLSTEQKDCDAVQSANP